MKRFFCPVCGRLRRARKLPARATSGGPNGWTATCYWHDSNDSHRSQVQATRGINTSPTPAKKEYRVTVKSAPAPQVKAKR